MDGEQRTGTTHRVMRQDDNGNRFLLARGLDRAGAEALAAEFEARGHKQLYWVEPEDPRVSEDPRTPEDPQAAEGPAGPG
ncbi:SPOR domain-containing protein [Kitasatospora cineracea]|uniref:SPOR domain-containing protein n=1 Tax=Kitasatospora cineracea TaxID=88074 RepID=UPI0033F11FEA